MAASADCADFAEPTREPENYRLGKTVSPLYMPMSFVDHLRIISQKPGFYLGQPSLSHLFAFIVGFQTGKRCPDDTSVLDSFEFWIYHHYGESGSRHWQQIIRDHAGGDDAVAFRRFFAHLEEYLIERERIGADAIKARYMQSFSAEAQS
jgi:hypothetical protein